MPRRALVMNHFAEGRDAMWAWYNGDTKYPENPYQAGTDAYLEWDTGFDDVIAYLESEDDADL